jgi:hypothetical protein
VTSGTNGYSAGAGYDLVTGLGTPVADLLVPDLAAFDGAVNNQRTVTVTPANSAYDSSGSHGPVRL